MQWIKAAYNYENLPKEGKFLAIDKSSDIAVVWRKGSYFIRGSWYGGCQYGCGGSDYFYDITHWAKLPELPKD